MIRKAKVLLEVEMTLDVDNVVYDIPGMRGLPKDFEPLVKELQVRASRYSDVDTLEDYEALQIGHAKVIRISGQEIS